MTPMPLSLASCSWVVMAVPSTEATISSFAPWVI
jgi:hypothetical protein